MQNEAISGPCPNCQKPGAARQPHVCHATPHPDFHRFIAPREPNPAERGELLGTITINIHKAPPGDPMPHVLHFKSETAIEGMFFSPTTLAAILSQCALTEAVKAEPYLELAVEFAMAAEDAGMELDEAVTYLQNAKGTDRGG
jgi:hypothetical protein